MTIDPGALRRRFPVLERKTYLNSGSYCALADTVRDAFNAYMEDRLSVGANWDVWVTKNEAVRTAMAAGAARDPDEIAVTASASAGINALASALDFSGPRATRSSSAISSSRPTRRSGMRRSRAGAEVVHVPAAADGYIPLEISHALIDERTQLVAVTQVCFRNGARLDIAGIPGSRTPEEPA